MEEGTMPEYKTIVFCTDFSKNADHAFEEAQYLASSTGAHLSVLHVIPDDVNEAARALPESKRAAEEKQARSLLERTYGAKTTVPTRFSVRRGNVAVEMLRFPAETNAELMVIGSRGLGRLTGLVGGCIGERVVKNAEIPVLVVPMHADLKR